MKMPPDNLDQDPTKPGFINLYAFFKVDDKAPDSEIDRSFRKMSLAWHPDKNRNNPEAAQMFAKLSAWRDLLKDSQKRAEYDANLAWFNTEKERKRRPAPPPQSRSSSYSYSEYTETPRSRNTYENSSGSRGTSQRSDYDPRPRYESREPQDYSPRYQTRTPQDYEPYYEAREPSDYEQPGSERRQHRSSRPRDDVSCECPDCVPPSRSSRSHRTWSERVYAEPPRYESQAPPSQRSSRRREAESCACPDCQPSYRPAQRRRPEIIIVEEINDDDFDIDFDDRPFFDYETRSQRRSRRGEWEF